MVDLNKTIEQLFVIGLLDWLKSHKRDFPWRSEKAPYKILIAEKFLQQTTYGHVLKVYERFLQKFPDVYSLSKSNDNEITKLIRPLGFQNQRARQLVKMSKTLVKDYKGNIPGKIQDLRKLSGIGKYIASSVACFAFDQDVPIIDLNVRRVLGRIFSWGNGNDNELFSYLAKMLPKGKAKEFNWGMIDFSSLVCSRKPKCKMCPFSDLCTYFKNTSIG